MSQKSHLHIIPAPVAVEPGSGSPFAITAETRLVAHGDQSQKIAARVAKWLSASLGQTLLVTSEDPHDGDILFVVSPGEAPAEDPVEGYSLTITDSHVRIGADTHAGLVNGSHTLRQLVPSTPTQSVTLAPIAITDYPRFSYRGAMLDVARHFFSVAHVTKYLDTLALLKINYLHLHLTDDQGWRIEIESWPKLTEIGGQCEMDGGAGGFYTQTQYREIVKYAASVNITIVPEIDVPGHTNAALSSYPKLNPDGVATKPYGGREVGFSTLTIDAEITYQFLDDVIREVASLTPGPYIHLGGDESLSTSAEDFLTFIKRATAIAKVYGKTLIGWHEMGRSRDLPAGTIGQYWSMRTPEKDAAAETLSFIEQGGSVIMSPADTSYLDIVYDESTPLGQSWTSQPTTLRDSYDWEPEEIVPEVTGSSVLGVEAPVWTETMATIADVEFMAFPRLAAIAEIGWSPRAGDASDRTFDDFTTRLTTFAAHWDDAEINYFRAPEATWHNPGR